MIDEGIGTPVAPDLFIVGATKCATSSLHYQLSRIPGFDCSTPKEPRFMESGLSAHTAMRMYGDVFSGSGIKVDANPNNLVIGYVPSRIKAINEDAKILIMVREPVQRFVSHYNYLKYMRPGREKLSIYDAADEIVDLHKFDYEEDYVPYVCKEWGNYKRVYIETGCYAHYAKKYIARFDVKFVVFEDYIKNPIATLIDICEWTGVECNFHEIDFRVRNAGYGFYNDIPRLREFYKSHNEELFKITGEIKAWEK